MNVDELKALGFPLSTQRLVYPHLKRLGAEGVKPKKMATTLKKVSDQGSRVHP